MSQVTADVTSNKTVTATDSSTAVYSSPSAERVTNSSTSNKSFCDVLSSQRIKNVDNIESENTPPENVKASTNYNTIIVCSELSTQGVINSPISDECTSNILSLKETKGMSKFENEKTLTKDVKAAPDCNMLILSHEPSTEGVTKSLNEGTWTMLSDQQTESMINNGNKKTGNIEVRNLEKVSTFESLKNTCVVQKQTFSFGDEAIVDMIKNSVVKLEKTDGASFEDICQCMEETNKLNIDDLKYYVNNSLKDCVDSGVLEKVSGAAGEEKFKIKESVEGVTKSMQNLFLKNETPNNTNLKHSLGTESIILDKKHATPFRDMIINMIKKSIKNLKKHNGASFEDVSKYMAEKYGANMIVLKRCVKNNLNECINSGVLERVSGVSGEERFKIKE